MILDVLVCVFMLHQFKILRFCRQLTYKLLDKRRLMNHMMR